MWFKKKSVLQADGNYDTEKSANRILDMRTTTTIWMNYSNSNNSINHSGLPSVADAGNYFYLPALGFYLSGRLYRVGDLGAYWSSSANAWKSDGAYLLSFYSDQVNVGNDKRFSGFRVDWPK